MHWSKTKFRKKLLVLLIVPAALFLMGAKLMEKPVENLETISGKWKGSGINDRGFRFEVEYVIRKDGSMDGWAGGGTWSTKSQMPPGTLKIKDGKLEYHNEKGQFRSGVLYEDAKGGLTLKFKSETGAHWDVRQKK